MKNERNEYKLGDLVQTNTKSINSEYPFEEIEYLDTGSITRGKIESLQKYKLSEAPSRAKRLVKQDDIVYSTVRPIQRHYGFIDNPLPNLVVSTGFVTITCEKDKLYPKFLYYLLSSNDSVEYLDVIAEASTSAYPSLKPSDIENLDITIPGLQEQKSIASILSSLDDKIDLLHRQNATLEKMAETLFRQWFVEEVKNDWEMGKIEDLFVLQRGFDLPIQNRIQGKYPIYASSGESGYHNKYKVRGPGVTTGRSGVLGNVFFIQEDFWPLNTSLFIKEFKKSSVLHSYFVLKTIDLNSFNAGSAVPTLNRNHVHEFPIEIPPISRIHEFDEIVIPLFKKIKSNQTQIRTLTALRDTLLPKLMSGAVSLSNCGEVSLSNCADIKVEPN